MSEAARSVPVWILRGVAGGGLALCAVGLVAGVVMFLTDATDEPRAMHGLGMLLGVALIAVSVVAALVLGPVLHLLIRRPRSGLRAARTCAGVVLSGTLAVLGIQVIGDATVPAWGLAAALSVGALVVIGLATWGMVPDGAGTSESWRRR